VVHASGEVLFCNRDAANLLGYPGPAQVCDGGVAELAVLTEAFTELGERRRVYPFLRKDGRSAVVEAGSFQAPFSGKLAWFTALRDVSEQEVLRAELERSNRLETLGQLCGSIAHDFNNLLTGIRGSLEMVRFNLDGDPETREAAIEAAEQAATRAASLTRELLGYSRGTTQRDTDCDGNAVVQEAARLYAQSGGGRKLALDACPGTGRAAIGGAHFYQVVMNLVSNAQHAVRGGGDILVATRAVRAVRPGDEKPQSFVQLVVADTGTGMDADTRRQIFEPFFTTKSPDEGTGLGLSTVYGLIRRARGWVEVDSRPSCGTTFTVYLPRVGHDEAAMGGVNTELEGQSTGKKVLVCDDETRLASLTAGLLEEFGFAAAVVGTGDGALERISAADSDVDRWLLDVNLSAGMSGREVLRELSRRELACPVILTSGLAREDVPSELFEHARVKSYLPKPYTVEELVATIHRAFDE
jgi:signal transduction histidine kinase/CheY-like chemotaxis protein